MDSVYVITSAEDELYHWGIKGMRWGVRRYQTKDGSLTPAGKKRYDKDMAKIKAETKKLKNQQRTDKKLSKLDDAKKNLAELKKSQSKKASTKTDKADEVETDAQKKDRILKSPNAKDVYENRHLFSNKEIQDLSLRLNNENTIKNMMPKEVDAGKARADKFFSDMENAATNINKAAKFYNTVANIYNAFSNGPVSLPKIDLDNSKGNRALRMGEKKKAKEAEDAKKKEADDAAAAKKKEADDAAAAKKKAEEMHRFEEYNRQYTEEPRSGTSTYSDNQYRSSGGSREFVNPNESRGLSVFSRPVTSVSTTTSSKGRSYTNDYDGWDDYVTVDSNPSSNRSTSSSTIALGQRTVAGLLPAPKEDDD